MLNWITTAQQYGVQLSAQQIAQFDNYLLLLLHWNERISLTAIRHPSEIQTRHFLDSLSCAVATGDLNSKRLIDVGSGAGFPGLPLKIAFPTLQLTLLDSVGKKTRFLETVVGELGLDDVQVIAGRAEQLGQKSAYRERYDWAVARAVTKLPALSEYLLPFVKVGGAMLAQKGASIVDEVASAQNSIQILGGGEPVLHIVQLPDSSGTANLVVVTKRQSTPTIYPRRVGVPAKRPL